MDHGGEVVGFALKQCNSEFIFFSSAKKASDLPCDLCISRVFHVALLEKSLAFDLLKTVPLIPGVFCL